MQNSSPQVPNNPRDQCGWVTGGRGAGGSRDALRKRLCGALLGRPGTLLGRRGAALTVLRMPWGPLGPSWAVDEPSEIVWVNPVAFWGPLGDAQGLY